MTTSNGYPDEMSPDDRDLDLSAEHPDVAAVLEDFANLSVPLPTGRRTAHIAAASAGVQLGPSVGRMAHRLPTLARAAAVAFVLLITLGGLAAAEALPGPIQNAAERVAAIAGIEISTPDETLVTEPEREVATTTTLDDSEATAATTTSPSTTRATSTSPSTVGSSTPSSLPDEQDCEDEDSDSTTVTSESTDDDDCHARDEAGSTPTTRVDDAPDDDDPDDDDNSDDDDPDNDGPDDDDE